MSRIILRRIAENSEEFRNQNSSKKAPDIFARAVACIGLGISLIAGTHKLITHFSDQEEMSKPLFVSKIQNVAPFMNAKKSWALPLTQVKEGVYVTDWKAYVYRKAEETDPPNFFRSIHTEGFEIKLDEIVPHYEKILSEIVPAELSEDWIDEKRQVQARRDLKIPIVFKFTYVFRSKPRHGAAVYFITSEVTWKGERNPREIKISPTGLRLHEYINFKEMSSATQVAAEWQHQQDQFLKSIGQK